MITDRVEKLGALFLAVFSTGLAGQLATTHALNPFGLAGAAAATLGSIALAVGVHLWPQQAKAAARR